MDTHTFRVEQGQLFSVFGSITYRYHIKNAFYKVGPYCYRLFALLLTFCLTLTVYKQYITTPTWENTISLGAIFATLGSSIVSVSSLLCSKHYDYFVENVHILQNRILKISEWNRWPFVKRISKYKVAKRQYTYHILRNPRIIFSIADWEESVALPVSKDDFYELPIYSSFVKLLYNRKVYDRLLFLFSNQEVRSEILAWDCLLVIYKNVVLYRIGQTLIWLGGCFVFTSILFSFFYKEIQWLIDLNKPF